MNHTFYGCASITNSDRTDIVMRSHGPPPGTYDPIFQDSQKIPLWTLKPKIQFTSCFHNTNPGVPAPGTYNINIEKKQIKGRQNQQKTIKYRQKNYVDKNSPVIALNLPTFLDQSSGYSFGYRIQPKVPQYSPGPIYYLNQLEEAKRRNKNFNSSTGLGLGTRTKFQRQDNPGPGQYEFSSQKLYGTTNKWTFGKSPRKSKPEFTNPIGPGQYNPKVDSSPRSFIMRAKPSLRRSQCTQTSPCSYNLPSGKQKRSAIFLKSEDRNINKPCDNLSPFTYQTAGSTLKPGGFSLGKKIHTTDQNLVNPGPGLYDINKQIFSKIGGFINKKQKQKKKKNENEDNFGKYNPKLDMTTFKYPQFSFKQSSNKDQSDQRTIGPGSYNVPKPKGGESFSIGKDQRFKPLKKEKPFTNIQLNEPANLNTCGILPSYLQKKNKNGHSQKPLLSTQKENTAGQNSES